MSDDSAHAQRSEIRVVLPHAAPHDGAARTPVRETQSVLHGELLMPATPVGIVIFVAASGSGELAQRGDAAACCLRHGLGCLTIDLLDADAARFADAAQHLPMLAERLLAVVAQLTRMIDSEAVPSVPIGLYATGDATPLAVRVAAIRDRAIAALCCRGGLVDLAGLQYLRELKAPLQLLVDTGDETAADNLRRARPHLHVPVTVEPLPPGDAAPARAAELAAGWFARQFRRRPAP